MSFLKRLSDAVKAELDASPKLSYDELVARFDVALRDLESALADGRISVTYMTGPSSARVASLHWAGELVVDEYGEGTAHLEGRYGDGELFTTGAWSLAAHWSLTRGEMQKDEEE